MSYDKPSKAEVNMILDAWFKLRESLQKIEREVDGCGPNCSKEFLRMGLDSVRNIAREAIGRPAPQQETKP